MEQLPFFVYGALEPGGKMHRHIIHAIANMVPAGIVGKLYDTPFGYPLLVIDDDAEEAQMIKGILIYSHEELYEEIGVILENIGKEGGFSRNKREVLNEEGEWVEAYVYAYESPPRFAKPI